MIPSHGSPSGHIPSLNGIRAVCVTLVVGAHIANPEPYSGAVKKGLKYVFNGGLGVIVFFVLSGFLITYLLAQEEGRTGQVSLKNFYVRRFVRILPVYVAYLFIVLALDLVTGLVVTPAQYLAAVTYTVNFVPVTWILGHLWSLSVEEQFYLLWPLVLTLLPRRSRWGVAVVLIALAPVFRVGLYVLGLQGSTYFKTISFTSFMANMDTLMIGCVGGLLLYNHRERVLAFLERRATLGRAIAALSIYAVWILQVHLLLAPLTISLGRTIWSVSAVYLILSYGFVHRGVMFTFLNLRAVQYVGVLSYSLYIWQQPFFNRPEAYGIESSILLQFPFNVIAAFAMAALSYHALEMPFLALRKRFRS